MLTCYIKVLGCFSILYYNHHCQTQVGQEDLSSDSDFHDCISLTATNCNMCGVMEAVLWGAGWDGQNLKEARRLSSNTLWDILVLCLSEAFWGWVRNG